MSNASRKAGAAGAESFLRHVLPAEGWYVYCWKREGEPWKQASTQSFGELADKVLGFSDAGYDTYFSCGSFLRPGDRTAAASAGASSLWLDIDVGADKAARGDGYATLPLAIQAYQAFLVATGLPPATVVASGSGLHLYWTFDRVLERDDWQRAAARLHAATLQHGLVADPSRTRDIASVLRPPGTYNFKASNKRPVLSGQLRSAIDVGYFLGFLPQAEAVRTVSAGTVRSGRHDLDLNREFLAYANDPVFGVDVAASCQWLKAVGVEARGNVPEPTWYAMLGLVGFLDDAEETAIAWSNGHESFTVEATLAKMEQAREKQSGPTTCSKFKDIWAEGCRGCPHKITTPLQLGRRVATPVSLAAVEDSADATVVETGSSHVMGPLPSIAHPYAWRQGDRALIVHSKNAEGEPELKKLYPYPIYISAVRKAEVGGGSFTTLKHWAPHDGWQEAVVPSGDLTAEGAFRTLGNSHIEIEPPVQSLFKLFLSRQKQDYRSRFKNELHHETFGWKDDDSFLIGETLIRGDGASDAGLSDELKKYAPKLKAAGNLTEWSAAAQMLFRPGYEHQGMALLAAFAAPLMRFAAYPGMVYSMVHELSGHGKTFSVEAAGSIYGQAKALEMSHRDEKVSTGDTLKSQYRQMALFKNLPVIVDELRDMDPEKLRAFVLTFTDGAPAKGLTKDGKMRDMFGAWATVLLTTSNKSMIDIITANNDPAAAARVFEVNATLPPDVDTTAGDKLRAALRRNPGVAGQAFVKAVIQRIEWVRTAVEKGVENYTAELQGSQDRKSGGDRYFASFLGVCMVSAAILNAEGILQVPLREMKSWALDRWRQQRIQVDASQKTSIEAMGSFLRDSISHMLIVAGAVQGREDAMIVKHPLRDPLTARFEQDSGLMYVDRRAVQRWCLSENQHFGALAADLFRQEIVRDRDARRNLGAGTQYKGMGQTPVWIVDTRHPAMSGEVREIVDPARAEIVALEKARRG